MFCPFTQHECNDRCALSDGSLNCAIYRIADALENVSDELEARRGFDLELTEEEKEAFREVVRGELQGKGERRGA